MAINKFQSEYQRKHETLQFIYQVILYCKDRNESYVFGKYKSARRYLNFVKRDIKHGSPMYYKDVTSVKFYYICSRFSNNGHMRVGCGETKEQALYESQMDLNYFIKTKNAHITYYTNEKND